VKYLTERKKNAQKFAIKVSTLIEFSQQILKSKISCPRYSKNSFQEILFQLDQIVLLLKAKSRLNGENILDNQDICMMFNLSPRSLQRYRSSGELPFMRIGGKPFYYESEVYKFIQSKRQNPLSEEDK